MGWSNQGPVRLGLILLLAAGSIDARECKIGCHGSAGNLLKYEPGKIYSYKLEGNSVTKLTGATGDQSKVGITADVQVSLLSSCEHVLKVTNVQVSGPDAKKYNLNKLSQQPIKFGLQNGRIESELCVNQAEDTVGLNIKRAVLSLIQSAVLKDNGYATQLETDISGTCPTGYEFSKSGNSVTVRKSRDLVKCAHREDISVPYLTTPYYVKSDFQSSPLLSSKLGGEQKIEGGILTLASREEHYEYRPGASEATAKVHVKTTLKYVSASAGSIPAACTEPRSIIFEKEHIVESQGASNQIVELVRQGCDSRTVEQDTAQQFSKLVRTVGSASKQDITSALQLINSGSAVKDKETAQRMLKDAIVMAQSASSVEVMAEILKRKEVTGDTARLWLLGLGAVKHASRASLMAVLPLLDGEPDLNAYLGIGSLAGKFCREHNCEGVNEINQLQIKLGAPLLKGCRCNTKKEENQLIASLKGLGNIKYLGPKIAGKIIECAEDKNVRPRIRAAALETIRTDPHKDQFKNFALNVMKNVDEDSELRIKAYLILAQCPCGKVAGAVKELLSKEESNQVGGFIVSHLRNLQASTNPDKQSARHYLGNIIPPRRFIIDPRRYSINQELSYAADIVNTGAAGEANIIYSQNSYIPRTLSLNLTVQLFGTAYNLFEVDTRAENLEYVAEHLFGPKGYLKTNEVQDVYEDGKHHLSSIFEKIASRYDQVLRPKRSISRDHLNAVANKVHLPKGSDDVDLDVSLKVLGSEVLWQHLHASEARKIDPENVVNNYFGSVDKLIDSLKNTDIDYRRHITFLDEELTYPTSMGLPLKLKTLGSAALRVKLDGKLDLPATIRDPQNTNVMVQLLPSAAVNVAGELLIDAAAFEAGTRVDLNVHSSTGSDITFRLLSGRGVDIKLGIPIAKQEVLSVKVDMTSVVRDDAQVVTTTPVKYETKRESYSGCFDQLNSIIGLTFCGEVSVPYESGKPIYPINGPVNLAVRIEKEDPSLSAYHIKALYEKNEETNVHSVELLLDTPNSSTNRKLSLTVEGSVQNPKRYLNVKVNSPWTNVDLNANVVNTEKEKSINAKLVYDQAEYVARAGVSVSPSGNKVTYVPIFEYKAPEGTKSALIGKKGGQKPKQQAVACGGSIIEEVNGNSHTYKINDLSITTPRTKYIVAGSVLAQPQLGSADLKISYDEDHVTVHGKLQSDGKTELHTELAVASTQYPDFGVSLKYDLLVDNPQAGQIDSKLIIVHGPDPKSDVSRIYLHNSYEKIIKDNKITSLKAHHELSYPVLNLEVQVKGKYTPKSLLAGFVGKLDKYSAKLETAGVLDHKNPGDYLIDIDGEVMGSGIHLESSRSLEGKDTSRFKNTITLKPGGVYQVNALVVHKFTEKEYNFQIDADASVPNQPSLKLVAGAQSSGSKYNGKIKLNFGDKCLIEGNSALTTGAAPHGSYKLVLTGYLESEGKLTGDKSTRNAVATLYLPKADRKMELKADLTLTNSKFSGVVNVCYDTKDPSKTIKIHTENIYNKNDKEYSLDSRNTLSHSNSEVKVNFKEVIKGTSLLQGTSYGELEVILPNKYKFGGKYSDSHNLEGENREGEAVLELYDEGEGLPQQKLKLSAVGKHISLTKQTIDGQAQLSYTSRDGKDANVHVNLKKLPNSNGKTSNINGEVGATGSLLEDPVNLKFESEISNEYLEPDDSSSFETDFPLLTYKVTGSIGSDVSVEAAGKLSGPTISNQLSAKLPDSSPVKNFKIVSNNLIDISDDSKEHSKVKLNNAVHWNDNKHVKVNVEGHCENDGVQYVVEYETDSIPKRRAAGSVHFSGEEGKADASINLSYDGKTADLSGKVEVNKEKTAANVHLLSNIPEKGKVDIVYRQKVVKDGRGFHADITISTKDKQMSGNAKVEFEPDHPIIELNFDHPEGKSRFLYKLDKKGDRHYASELKAKWTANGGGSLAVDSEANLASVDNFFIKANYDNPQLKWKKVHLDISNKPIKGEAKKITFSLKSDDKIIVSGSSNYNYKEEGDVAVLEGNGNIKIEDQSYPLTFQATKQVSENAQLAKLNVKAGKRSLNIEAKVNPHEFSVERVYCREAKQCSKAQISAKVRQDGVESYEQSTVVVLDLSLFNPHLHDITYKDNYKRDKLTVDHLIEIQWAQDAKLKYNAYIHEHAAGVYVTLPKRTVGGELKYEILRKKENVASMKFEAGLDLNKGKEPKWSFVAASTAQYDKGVATFAGESKVSHPSLAKDLVVKGQVQISDKSSKLVDGIFEIDLSKNPNSKLVGKIKLTGTKDNHLTVIDVKNKECGIDIHLEEKVKVVINGKDSNIFYNLAINYLDSKNTKHDILVKLDTTPQKFQLVYRDPEIAVMDIDYRLDKGYYGTLNMFGKKYTETFTLNKDTNLLKYQLSGLEGGKTLEIEAALKLGGSGILKASLNEKKACSFDVALDETNFLQSKYSYDIEVAKSIYGVLVNEIKVLAVEGEKAITNLAEKKSEDIKHIFHCASKSLPDPNAVGQYFQSQLSQIRDEIASDKTVKEASQFLKEVTGVLGEQIISIAEELNRFCTSIAQLIKESVEQIRASVNEILPKIKPSFQRIAKTLNGLLEQYIKLSVQIADLISNKLKEHEADIKAIADATVGYVQDIGKLVGKVVLTINSELEKLVKQSIETLGELPIVADIQERLKEFKDLQIPEEVFSIYHELIEALKQLLPTQEASQFLDTLTNVVEKILKREDIPNKDEVVKQLYKELVAAIRSIIALLAQNTPQTGLLKPAKLQTSLPLHLLRLPSGGIRFSLVNFLTNRQSLPGLNEILAGIKLSLNPVDYIPPYPGIGAIIGGTEVITYDGLHMNIQGTCSYILSEDYKDRNFSLVGQMQNGALQSLTLTAGKDSIEIRSTGTPLVNGQASTFPAHAGELWAWKRPQLIGFASKAGVVVMCSHNLDNCGIEVSGFYFGRLRGLLGNLNGETYDERMTPEGKIVENSGDLANSWKLDGSCAPCPSGQHKHNRVSVCTDIFVDDPLTVLCRPFVNPAPFRDACDDLASRLSNKENAACSVSKAYAYACYRKGVLLARLPDQCATCEINGKKVDAGDSVSVKPENAADIVLVADLMKENELNYKEIAVPLVAALKSQLGKKGISDVHVTLVGGNKPKGKYHNYYSNKQGELAYDPASANVNFVERVKVTNETVGGQIQLLFNHLLSESGLTARNMMYQDVLKEVVFRPNALKAIVGVHGLPCSGPSVGTAAAMTINAIQLELRDISYNLIAPMKGVKVGNGEVAVLNEKESVLCGGEKVADPHYSYQDMCVTLAYETNGNAINADGVRESPKKAELIEVAAEKIVSSILERNAPLECSCDTTFGIVPKPICMTAD
ncbi:unnamed protein product [Nezara viridula]|uniref:Apolipophorin n=1 Tax=Nezara viridula TaxID=85310 RepID=A0A9P0E3J0_NEZVI|nr:unnamed protein product [Nezara viridula]